MKMRHINLNCFLILIIASLILSCAITQNKYDDNTMGQIVKGRSTKADVKKILGEPKSVSQSERGNVKIEHWIYSKKGVTTGNMVGDAFFKALSPMGNVKDDMANHDTLFISFDNDIVSDIRRTTATNDN